MLQLQNYDVSSYKGLYIDAELVEAVLPLVNSHKDEVVGASIHMVSGKVWNVRQSVCEIHNMLADYNDYKKAQK